MAALDWTSSHAVFVTEMDDEHAEIFAAICALRDALGAPEARSATGKAGNALVAQVDRHFAHEERLMRAARYTGFRWHKQQHDEARRRVKRSLVLIGEGEPA